MGSEMHVCIREGRWPLLPGVPHSCLLMLVAGLCMLPAVRGILGELLKAHAHPWLLIFQPALSVK